MRTLLTLLPIPNDSIFAWDILVAFVLNVNVGDEVSGFCRAIKWRILAEGIFERWIKAEFGACAKTTFEL